MLSQSITFLAIVFSGRYFVFRSKQNRTLPQTRPSLNRPAMALTLTLTVPEAAASSDTIQFKLLLGGKDCLAFIEHHDHQVQPTVFRSFQQISWLHEKLTTAFPEVVVPPLPEPPVLSRMDDQDYVERKRLQVERFFSKMIRRPVFANHADFIMFMSNAMVPVEVNHFARGVLSFLRFNRVIRPRTDRGFKSYKATEPVEGNDHDAFHRHQIYILMQESYFGAIAESLNQVIQNREGLGDALTHMGDNVIEITQSKYRLGQGDDEESRKAQRALDHRMQLFGLLTDELGFISTRQGIEETMKFGDAMIESKNAMDGLKAVFNARTQKLMTYAESMKHRNKKRDKADKMKLRMGLHAPEVQATIAEEEEAAESLRASREQFDACQDNVKKEIQLFEKQKHRDIKQAIGNYVQLTLRYERAKLASLEKALDEMQHFRPKPISLAHALGATEDEQSSITSTSTYDTTARAKRRSGQQKRKRRQSRGPQAIHSSVSLPTWTRKMDEDEETSGQPSGNTGSVSARVSPFARYEGHPRVHPSASYDERLGNAGWSKEGV